MRVLRQPGRSGPGLVDAFRILHPERTDVYTGNGWGERSGGDKIDAVYVAAGADVVAAEILRPRRDGRPPSDHDPVTATVRLHLERTELEITDLGDCRSCAGGIERAVERVPSVLRAAFDEERPVLRVYTPAGSSPDLAAVRAAIRDAGYTAEAP